MWTYIGEKCSWGLYHPVAVSTQFEKEPPAICPLEVSFLASLPEHFEPVTGFVSNT